MDECKPLVDRRVSSGGAEGAVTRVAEARHDVPLLVEFLVDHGGVHAQAGVPVGQLGERGRAGDHAHDADVGHRGAGAYTLPLFGST